MVKSTQVLETVLNVYRKTIAYELMGCKVNDDGTCTWYHSDIWKKILEQVAK